MNPAYAINGKPASSDAFYAIACDPGRSVAVEACAGAGKTWMLIERMVKALQDGAEPDQILAITFTKKAAGEMRERLQKRLAEPELRELRARILTSGRSVQISTFHAWFAQLLKAAPLAVLQKLKYPLSYELLEDDTTLLPELRHAFYAAALTNQGLRDDFAELIEELGRSKVDDALAGLLAKRVEFELIDAQGLLESSVEESQPHVVDLARLSLVARLLGAYKTDELKNTATALETALTDSNLEAAQSALLTKEFAPRKFRSKILDTDREVVVAAQNDLLAKLAAEHQHTCWLYQQRMTRVGRAWLACFVKLKRDQGLVDMADLERAATLLLSDPEVSGAVQERLDQRLRHVMIDEFQDTNPLQWQAMHAWLAGYAGSGGGQDRPSLFIVGDPKQSIYRFRRAEPRVFAAAQAFMQETFDAELLSCDHTRRNAAGVLAVVNSAMMNAQEANEYVGFRPHTTESEEVGAALCLPMIEREKKEVKKEKDGAMSAAESTWRDSFTMPRVDAEETLKEREADQAARWIAANANGQSVMVLSRTHEPLSLIQQALQQYGVQASKLEKNDLADAPAVQDVLALLNFLVSPHSDLDLARALKSPLFAWTDAQLMLLREQQLACLPDRKTWFDLLTGDINEQLTRWQTWLAQLPPHDALQAIYDDGDVLNKYLAAMPDAIKLSSHASLQALLSAALQVDGGRFLSAYAFVRAMRAKVQSIKAPAVAESTTAVQLLTVHGAKGLEADVVLLLSSDPEPRKMQSMTTLIDWQPEDSAPQKFVFLLNEANPPMCAKALLESDFRAREVEEINTMYVATTRARQTLVLSASEAWNANPKSVWHRLKALCTPVVAEGQMPAKPHQIRLPAEMKILPAIELTLPPIVTAAAFDELNVASKKGSALHRLLQWQSADAAALAAISSEFALTKEQVQAVSVMAKAMLSGEAAWIWDERHIDWQANEYELFYEKEIFRIDRLVKRRDTQQWWLIDFKSALNPEKSANLLEQLEKYRQALYDVFAINENLLHVTFVTGDGRLAFVPNKL
ncbi:MAG: hypothetical protein RIT15_504 [Pseudomonadota bacterium]